MRYLISLPASILLLLTATAANVLSGCGSASSFNGNWHLDHLQFKGMDFNVHRKEDVRRIVELQFREGPDERERQMIEEITDALSRELDSTVLIIRKDSTFIFRNMPVMNGAGFPDHSGRWRFLAADSALDLGGLPFKVETHTGKNMRLRFPSDREAMLFMDFSKSDR